MKIVIFILTILSSTTVAATTVNKFFLMYDPQSEVSERDHQLTQLVAQHYANGVAKSAIYMNEFLEVKHKVKFFCAPSRLPIHGTLLIQLVRQWKSEQLSLFGSEADLSYDFALIAIGELEKVFPCE